MPQLPEDYRPDPYFDENGQSPFVNQMTGFITLSSMAMIGTVGFARAGVVTSNATFSNGTRYFAISQAEADMVETYWGMSAAARAANPIMGFEVGSLITQSATAGMAQGVGLFSAEALIALSLENALSPSPRIPAYFRSINDYIEYHYNHLGEGSGAGGGGAGSPPTPPSGGGWVCYTYPDGTTSCFWTPN